jgi:hypothetical protein
MPHSTAMNTAAWMIGTGPTKSIARIAMPSMMVLHRERAVDRGQFDLCEIDDDGLKPCAARGQAPSPLRPMTRRRLPPPPNSTLSSQLSETFDKKAVAKLR